MHREHLAANHDRVAPSRADRIRVQRVADRAVAGAAAGRVNPTAVGGRAPGAAGQCGQPDTAAAGTRRHIRAGHRQRVRAGCKVRRVGDVRRRHRDGIRQIRCPIAPIHKRPAVGGRRGQDRVAADIIGAAPDHIPAATAVDRERRHRCKVCRVGDVRRRHRDGVRIVRCAIAPTGEQVTAVRSCGQWHRRPHSVRAATGDCPAAQRIGNATHGRLGSEDLRDCQRLRGDRFLGQSRGQHPAFVHQNRHVGLGNTCAVAQLPNVILAHGPERAVRFHKHRITVATGNSHHVARHRDRYVGVAGRAIAQLPNAILAHAPERAVRFHKQRMIVTTSRGHYVASHRDRCVGVAGRAIAQLAKMIPAHRPERAVRLHKQRMFETTRHRHHVVCHQDRQVGVAERANAQLALGIVAHRPERAVRFHE